MHLHKLDNPVWYALEETHKAFGIEMAGYRFYNPKFSPFGGYLSEDTSDTGLLNYAKDCPSFYIVGSKPKIPNSLYLQQHLVCDQMLLEAPITLEISEPIRTLTTKTERQQLFALVNLVQPGYFSSQTSALGNYYGIFKDGQLVATTGERMQLEAFTEISAVVTHPEHVGKGYAKQLIQHTADGIFNQRKTPFLHVSSSNTPAIGLYNKLGFNTRRKLSFWHLKTVS